MRTCLTVLDALSDPDGVAATAAADPVGCADVLGSVDLVGLTETGRTDMLVACARQVAFWQARLTRTLAAVAHAHPDPDPEPEYAYPAGPEHTDPQEAVMVADDGAVMAASCALRVALPTARARLRTAVDLLDRLPATTEALECGDISLTHALTLSGETSHLPRLVAAAVENDVLPLAGQQSPGAFTRAVRRAVLRHRPPQTAEQDLSEAFDQRTVRFGDATDTGTPGMGSVSASLSAVDSVALKQALTGMAKTFIAGDRAARRQDPDAGLGVRSMDQARADALAVLAHAALTDPNLPTVQGRRPRINVTVALSTLLGLDDTPGELVGYGPIPAALARRLAADPTGTWRRLITDELGTTLLDYGHTTYRPPQDLIDFVAARDQVCQAPTATDPPPSPTWTTAPPTAVVGPPPNTTSDPTADPTTASQPSSAGPSPSRTHPPGRSSKDPNRHRTSTTPNPSSSPPTTATSTPSDPSSTTTDTRSPAPLHEPPSTDDETPNEDPDNNAVRTRLRRSGRSLVWTAPTGHTYRPARPNFPIDTTTRCGQSPAVRQAEDRVGTEPPF